MRPLLRAAPAIALGIGGLVVGFVAGVWAGLGAGHFNARIDFCDDDTSGRFIADAAAREASCVPAGSSPSAVEPRPSAP